MSNERQFGIPEGLGRRLNTWANQLACDKRYPWVGTGLLEDLKRAAIEVGGAPPFDEMFPERDYTPKPVEEEDEFAEYRAKAAALGFDL